MSALRNPTPQIYTEERLTRELARRRFGDFVLYTKPDYEINWHHKLKFKKLQDFADGKIKRLMLFEPPRHGKSELVSRRLPAYIFGQKPDKKIISASYSADLSSIMNRDVQRIIDDPLYQNLFPETYLNGSNVRATSGGWMRNSDIFEIVGRGGMYRSAGVGGGITGMGADILLIDDPIKNKEEAFSITFRDKVFDWYMSTAYTRLEKDGQVLITLTRWHEDDLAGRLLKLAKDDPNADQFEVIRFPALKETDEISDMDKRKKDEPLWDNKYNQKRLFAIKASIGHSLFQSMYQQNPTPDDGNVFKRAWIKRYFQLPFEIDEWIMSWDMSFKDEKKSDYVVGQVWARKGAAFYLVHEIRGQWDFPTTLSEFQNYVIRFPQAFTRLIEDKANGPAIIASVKRLIPGIIPVDPKINKIARAKSASVFYEAGNVFYPDQSIAPWIEDHIDELMAFPSSTHDDRVDSASQAVFHFQESSIDILGAMQL